MRGLRDRLGTYFTGETAIEMLSDTYGMDVVERNTYICTLPMGCMAIEGYEHFFVFLFLGLFDAMEIQLT